MKFIKLLCLIAFLFFVVLFLFGCSVKASSNNNGTEKCNISTSSGTVYKNIDKRTVNFDRNDYILNFRNEENKTISTNSFTTICDGTTF